MKLWTGGRERCWTRRGGAVATRCIRTGIWPLRCRTIQNINKPFVIPVVRFPVITITQNHYRKWLYQHIHRRTRDLPISNPFLIRRGRNHPNAWRLTFKELNLRKCSLIHHSCNLCAENLKDLPSLRCRTNSSINSVGSPHEGGTFDSQSLWHLNLHSLHFSPMIICLKQ